MTPELHEAVHDIVLDIVNAAAVDDKRTQWSAYQRLAELCETSEREGRRHPFQWEALGDFTTDRALAIGFYEKALGYAREARLEDYVASICFAMAEALLDMGEFARARSAAWEGHESASKTADLELRQSISELLLRLSEGTWRPAP
ncbi:hypothetical protein PQS90_18365 [Pseudomonas sp. BLCC-B13]|uniref:hypothetical protein n=1 Tax=Pseudomonas sp. BLCC-B13 TaxID=3025314 RepID=UPI00234E551F|nr:hypothetical protein [Pseudomonas sp. BLCC-B13]MDC7827123.1 hypothetical protein [Pseudomonas sp. BLCC-B13]